MIFWHHGVVVITTAQLHSTKPKLRFCAGSNPARGMSELHNGEDPWQWSQLEIRLKVFRLSAILQKQFIIITITPLKTHTYIYESYFLHTYILHSTEIHIQFHTYTHLNLDTVSTHNTHIHMPIYVCAWAWIIYMYTYAYTHVNIYTCITASIYIHRHMDRHVNECTYTQKFFNK